MAGLIRMVSKDAMHHQAINLRAIPTHSSLILSTIFDSKSFKIAIRVCLDVSMLVSFHFMANMDYGTSTFHACHHSDERHKYYFHITDDTSTKSPALFI